MQKHISVTLATAFLIISIGLIACGQQEQQTAATTETAASVPTRAIAVLHPTEGNDVSGVVTFTKVAGGMKVMADVRGLTPGLHGFHIHELGDCSASDATSAGGHFNPEGVAHGAPTDSIHHVGDLGNLEADSTGQAHYEWTDPMLTFEGEHDIIGRGVIIHAGEDDLTSQPTGAAGARVACGVIGIAEM
jgi:Cu-Zn family superoxide dismutase